MGDLQCPARIYLAGPAMARAAGERLRAERVTAVYTFEVCAAEAGTVEGGIVEAAARDAGEVLQCRPVAASGGAAAEAGSAERVARLRAALESLADRHRGEAVLVVAPLDVLSAALGGLVAGWETPSAASGDVLLAVEADADGWRLVSPLFLG